MQSLRQLFIPRKAAKQPKENVTYDDYGIDMRAIERWATSLPSGGYASLTGEGETVTPGELTQEGGFSVNDATGVGITWTVSGGGGIDWSITGGGGFLFTQTGGGGIAITTTEGVILEATQAIFVESGQGLTLDAGTLLGLFGTTGIQIASVSAGFTLYTAPNLAGLEAAPTAPAWGFTGDGHIYYYPTGGPWTLKV